MRRRSSSESQSDYEREKDRRRRLWMIQQEREREHEKLKQKKIEEYERKRAELLKLGKLNVLENNTSSSSKSKGSNTREEDLKQIRVKIQRKLPGSSAPKRDANNPEPTTDGEKLIQFQAQPLEVEEYRTIEVANKSTQAKKSQFERRSVSLNIKTQRTLSPEYHRSSYLPSHRSRRDEYSRRNVNDYDDRDRRSSKHSSRSRDNNHDNKRRTSRGRSHSREQHTSRGRSNSKNRRSSRGRSNSKNRRSSRGHSHSRERDYKRSERDHSRSSRSVRNQECRGRSRDRSRDRRDEQGIPRDWIQVAPIPYVAPMPYPAYYGSFPPGPMMFRPPMMPPIRGPRGPIPPMPPTRPQYLPRFIPPPAYRGRLPYHPNYPWMN